MKRTGLVMVICGLFLRNACAWDYEGHRLVNQLALASLPKEFPGFITTPAAQERIAFLSGEPDRWRNTSDLALKHCNNPDHYIDLEELAHSRLKPETLPPLRYDFVAHLARERAARPEHFPPIDPAANTDHTRELVGLLPWTIIEYYAKLKSQFSVLKTFEAAGGTPDEIANTQANIVYTMGVMGHFVGDAAQPLHTTVHFNGWTGPNPHQYTTTNRFHSWIDGGFIARAKIESSRDALKQKLRPARIVELDGRPAAPEQVFAAVVRFVVEQNQLVEPLYQLEKEGKLAGEGEAGLRGKPFIEGQLVKGAQLLGDIWYSAWQQAGIDDYLRRQLEKRREMK